VREEADHSMKAWHAGTDLTYTVYTCCSPLASNRKDITARTDAHRPTSFTSYKTSEFRGHSVQRIPPQCRYPRAAGTLTLTLTYPKLPKFNKLFSGTVPQIS